MATAELAKKTEHPNLSEMSKEDLKGMIQESVRLTIDAISRMGQLVREWSERGYSIFELELTFVDQYLLVGCGQVLAGAFFRFGHDKVLWKLVSHLPIPIQRQLCEPPFRVPVESEDGSHRMIDPLRHILSQPTIHRHH